MKDKEKTLETAKEAMEIYNHKKRLFDLIGVAQGKTVEEYLDCYKKLQKLGYKHIAIGGMLQRNGDSVRYVMVNNESILREALKKIREFDHKGWLFALGCYAPSRHGIFLENKVFGADYKGWIFRYEQKSPKRGHLGSQKRRFRAVRNFIEENVLIRSQVSRKRSGPRLLILSCGKFKLYSEKKMPAYKLYNGPAYRILRKYVDSFSNIDGLDIMILSAKHGLISPKKSLNYYDQRMTRENATKMNETSSKKLSEMTKNREYSQVFVYLGKEYLPAIQTFLDDVEGPDVILASGTQGERLKQLKEWILS